MLSKSAVLQSAALALLFTTPAFAKSTPAAPVSSTEDDKDASAGTEPTTDDIVVTAQRREQSLLSVPIAITAISGDALARTGVNDSSQLAAVVPNLQINSAYGKTQPNFTLRGIGVGNEYSANQASPIGVYVDDAYIASRASQGSQLYDLERVEVLRGPQGTLFGRNTTGGAINFITRKPELSGSNGYTEVGYGNFNSLHAQAALETTLIDGELGIRATGNADRNDPTFRNLVPGIESPNGGTSYSGRVQLRWKPSDRFDLLVKAYGSRDKLTQAALHSIGATPSGVNPLTGYSRAGLGFYDVEYGFTNFRRTTSYGFLAKAAWKAGDNVTINSLTSYDGGLFLLHNDGDATPLGLLDYNPKSVTRQFNQELRANIETGSLNAVIGAYYGTDRTKTDNHFGLYTFFKALGAPVDFTGAHGGFTINQRYTQLRQSFAVFAQADYKITDRLTVTGGLRYTWDRSQFADALASFGDYDYRPLVYTVTDPAHPGTAFPTVRARDGALTGRAAISYTFDDGTLLYASYNRGYRGGTFNGNAYTSNSQLNYVRPETVNAYEAGAKGRLFDGAISYSLAGFYYDYKNQQTNEVIAFVGFLRNAGKATVYGGELEFDAKLYSDLKVHASLGLLHSRYDQLTLGKDPATNSLGVNLAGNELPFAPGATAQVGVDWTVARVADGRIDFLPNISYSSRQWFSPFNARESFPGDPIGNGRLQQPAYVTTDAQLLWSNDKVTIGLFAKNLFQKHYYLYGLDLRTFFGLDFFVPANPRTFGATVRVNL